MDSPSSSTRNPRPGLLQSCGASLLTVAHNACHRVEEFRDPLGIVSRTLFSIANPILRPIEHRWLSILSFVDDILQFLEDLAIVIFPPSANLFNKLDDLALFADSLPKRIDDAIDVLFAFWSSKGSKEWSEEKEIAVDMVCKDEKDEKNVVLEGSDEKDIAVDMECNDEKEKKSTVSKDNDENNSKERIEVAEEEKGRVDDDGVIREAEKSFKEIIEEFEKMTTAEEEEKKKEGGEKHGDGGVVKSTKEDVVVMRDPIMELFDEGWQMKPLKGKK